MNTFSPYALITEQTASVTVHVRNSCLQRVPS
jgi:hypothetical protein